jgi:hypothetical protein
MCVELEILILKSGKKKYEIARELDWHPSKLSAILSEVYEPSSLEQEDLCVVLGCQVEEAFPAGRREAV